jgi:hypothetical protein
LKCQHNFIRGRFISDGVIALREILQETKNKKMQGFVFKINIEKAYDKVNWELFLSVFS